MSESKNKSEGYGKGDARRPMNESRFRDNYDLIFKKKSKENLDILKKGGNIKS